MFLGYGHFIKLLPQSFFFFLLLFSLCLESEKFVLLSLIILELLTPVDSLGAVGIVNFKAGWNHVPLSAYFVHYRSASISVSLDYAFLTLNFLEISLKFQFFFPGFLFLYLLLALQVPWAALLSRLHQAALFEAINTVNLTHWLGVLQRTCAYWWLLHRYIGFILLIHSSLLSSCDSLLLHELLECLELILEVLVLQLKSLVMGRDRSIRACFNWLDCGHAIDFLDHYFLFLGQSSLRTGCDLSRHIFILFCFFGRSDDGVDAWSGLWHLLQWRSWLLFKSRFSLFRVIHVFEHSFSHLHLDGSTNFTCAWSGFLNNFFLLFSGRCCNGNLLNLHLGFFILHFRGLKRSFLD